MPSAHAKLSPSGADRWVQCPGSVHAEPGAVDTGSVAADEGTAQHEVLSRCLTLGKSPKWFKGETVKGVRITGAHVAAVEVVVAWVKEYMKAHKGAVLYSEKEIDIGPAFGLPVMADGKSDLWGTSDIVIHAGPELVIADAKFGYHRVKALANRQLTLYGIGEEHANGMMGFEDIRLAIIQPAHGVDEYAFPVAELHEAREGFVQHVKDALNPLAPRVPSTEACKWCRAAAICPTLKDFTLLAAQKEFAAFDTLSLNEIREVLDKEEITKQYIRAVYTHALRLAQSGVTIPGYKVVTGEKRRAWMDESKAAKALEKAGVDLDEACPRKLCTPAQAEKLIGGKVGKDLVAALAAKPPGDPTLVPVDDDRSAEAPVFPEVLD